MKINTEKSLYEFVFWSGAKDRAEQLSVADFNQIEAQLEELYPDGMSETEVNDLFWFDEDFIAEMLGYSSWEELEEERVDDNDEE